MIDNFDKIQPLLHWRSEDDFYFLQILQRKKDHKKGKVNGTNNNSRLIKAYYIKSLEHFEFIKPEVIELCKIFNARAGINLNRRSFKKMALQHLKKCTDQIINEDFKKAYKAYSSVVGAFSNDNDKKWIVDIDDCKEPSPLVPVMLSCIDRYCDPICEVTDSKILTILPTKSGLHIITKPFNVQQFREKYPDVEIHKNNPTNLFIP